MSRDTCQRCLETSHCALGGIRTPNLLIRRLSGVVSGGRRGRNSRSGTVIRQLVNVAQMRLVAVSTAVNRLRLGGLGPDVADAHLTEPARAVDLVPIYVGHCSSRRFGASSAFAPRCRSKVKGQCPRPVRAGGLCRFASPGPALGGASPMPHRVPAAVRWPSEALAHPSIPVHRLGTRPDKCAFVHDVFCPLCLAPVGRIV
jgi:hypothetical protein